MQQRLEKYLLTQEKVRLFTPESLKLQIELHEAGNSFRKSRMQLLIIMVTAFVVALSLALFLPLDTPEQRGVVGGATAFSLVTMGAASLFLTAQSASNPSCVGLFVYLYRRNIVRLELARATNDGDSTAASILAHKYSIHRTNPHCRLAF